MVVAGNAKFLGHIPPIGTIKPNVDFFHACLEWLRKPYIERVEEINLSESPDKYELLQFLISEGADVNARTRSGETPLMLAVCARNNREVIEMLIEENAIIDARNEHGLSALMIACPSARMAEYLCPGRLIPGFWCGMRPLAL